MFEDIAKLKMTVNYVRNSISERKWERRWSEWIRKMWSETPTWGWDEPHAVYQITIPFTRKEYIGETTRTPFQRMKAHLSKVWTGTQEVYKALRRIGPYKSVLTPLIGFGRETTKVERLREEGRVIWDRNASMNQRGKQDGGDVRRIGGGGEVLFGKRWRFREVPRLRRAKTKDDMIEGAEVRNEEKARKGTEQAKLEAHLRALVVRLGRRPWKDHKEKDTKTSKEVLDMKPEQLKHLMRMVMTGADATTRSIARKNLKMILRPKRNVAWVYTRIKSPVFGEHRVKEQVRRELKEWSHLMLKEEGVTVVMEVCFGASASKSMMQLLSNAEEMGRRRKAEQK